MVTNLKQLSQGSGPPRPYIDKKNAQLQELIEHANDNIETLHLIYCELLFRGRRLARLLRKQVEEQLTSLKQEFPWPSTESPKGDGALPDDAFQYKRGLLGFMGYRVGVSGAPSRNRQALLRDVYCGILPKVNSHEYMSGWGGPKSARRLKKMAESIASFVRNHRRRSEGASSLTVKQWETDLRYLKSAYYDGVYKFRWPSPQA